MCLWSTQQRIRKHRQLLMQLQELVYSSPDNTTTMFDVLNYFLQRLAASQPASRQQAIKVSHKLDLDLGPGTPLDVDHGVYITGVDFGYRLKTQNVTVVVKTRKIAMLNVIGGVHIPIQKDLFTHGRTVFNLIK